MTKGNLASAKIQTSSEAIPIMACVRKYARLGYINVIRFENLERAKTIHLPLRFVEFDMFHCWWSRAGVIYLLI